MAPPVTRSRRTARRIFALLLLLAAVGAGAWWFFRRETGRPLIPVKVPDPEPVLKCEAERPLMATQFRIVLYHTDRILADRAMEAAFAKAGEIAAICSDHDPDSELSRLNRSEPNQPVPLSPTLAAVLAHARETAEVTSGLYDPTLGTLTALWRQSRESGTLPSPGALEAARRSTGWRHLEINLPAGTATIGQAGLRIDLGGIAKGFAADQMLGVLQSRGIRQAFIAAGNDIRLGDPPPGKDAWMVGLHAVSPSAREFIQAANCAVSTSGELWQPVAPDGQRHAPVIDPSTGLGLGTRIAATVIAPTATQSDAFATFACIAPDAALRAFFGGEIHCRIVEVRGPDTRDRRSRQFPQVRTM